MIIEPIEQEGDEDGDEGDYVTITVFKHQLTAVLNANGVEQVDLMDSDAIFLQLQNKIVHVTTKEDVHNSKIQKYLKTMDIPNADN